MERGLRDSVLTRPIADRLVSGFCTSAHAFALPFLQTSPHGKMPLGLTILHLHHGWRGDLHPSSCGTCSAHSHCKGRGNSLDVIRET
jgi:hypothetical protein